MNALTGTKFYYSKNNPDFIISESNGGNLIYAPKDAAKRKLAEIIANKFIDNGQDFVILPSYDHVFRIEIDKRLEGELSKNLKESFDEYYKNG